MNKYVLTIYCYCYCSSWFCPFPFLFTASEPRSHWLFRSIYQLINTDNLSDFYRSHFISMQNAKLNKLTDGFSVILMYYTSTICLHQNRRSWTFFSFFLSGVKSTYFFNQKLRETTTMELHSNCWSTKVYDSLPKNSQTRKKLLFNSSSVNLTLRT